MAKINNAGAAAILIIFMAVIAGCAQQIEETPTVQPKEEEKGTGILAVESSPADARIYVDGELKGATPSTLYTIPSGEHDILVRKEGYADFVEKVVVSAGRTEEITARLSLIKPEAQEPVKEVTSDIEPEQRAAEPASSIISGLNKAEIGGKIILYFDFDNNLTTSLRKQKTDVFFRNYKSYLYYVALYPAKLGVVEKPLGEVTRDDCIPVKDASIKLLSGQTLCVKTMEGNAAAISSAWETEPTEVQWVFFG